MPTHGKYIRYDSPEGIPHRRFIEPIRCDVEMSPDLGVLASLSGMTDSNVAPDLAATDFWRLTTSQWEYSLNKILSETVAGYIDSSPEWRSWARYRIADRPPWLTASSRLVEYLGAPVEGLHSQPASHSRDVAMAVCKFAASVSTYSLDSLDYLSFDGVKSLKNHFTSGEFEESKLDPPNQLLLLYKKSLFETRKGPEVRAHYLGKALAITSAMTILGGENGFSDKFGTALQALSLSESWSEVKLCVGKIGRCASPRAAVLMFYVMELLAKDHPESVRWNTGFTAARITAMAEVLAEQYFTPSHIEINVQHILTNEEERARRER